jgi:hypothetical protein
MKKICVIILGSIFLSLSLFSQNRWTQEYFPNLNIVCEDFIESYDNGYLLTGKYGPNYVHFVWLIKTDINGQTIWNKTFGEMDSYIAFFKLDINYSGDIFLSGSTSYYDSYRDPIIMKLNACVEKEWCRVYNTPDHYDYAHSVVVTKDGGCAVILRYIGGDYVVDRICLIRFDTEGNLLWKQCYNSNDTNLVNQDSRSLILTQDGGFLITATCDYLVIDSSQAYWPKQYFIKTDSLGNFQWETVVHSDNNLAGGDAWTTTLNPDRSFYYSSVSHYDYETNYSSPALIKMDLEGNVIDIYDIVNGYVNGGLTYAQFINDSVLAASCVYGNTQDDITTLAVLIDTVGNILDSTDLGPGIQKKVLRIGYDSKLLFFYDVLQNGQFDVFLRKLNQNLEDDTIYTMPFTYDSLCPYQIVSDTIVQDDCGLIVGVPDDRTIGRYDGKTIGLVVWPNPAREWISLTFPDIIAPGKVELVVFNVFGQEVIKETVIPFNRISSLNISSLSPGIYFVRSQDNRNRILTGKFVVGR